MLTVPSTWSSFNRAQTYNVDTDFLLFFGKLYKLLELGCDTPFNKHLFFVSSKYWCVKKSYRKLNLWLANGLVIKNTRQNSKACWNILCQISCYYEMKCKHCVRSREENTFLTAPGPDSWPRDKVKTLWGKSNWMRLTRSVPDSLTVSRLSSATDSEARAAWTR